MRTVAVEQDCIQSRVQRSADILLKGVSDHQRLGPSYFQELESMHEGTWIRFARRQHRGRDQDVDLISEAELLEFQSLLVFVAIGEHGNRQSCCPRPTERGYRVIEGDPTRLILDQVAGEQLVCLSIIDVGAEELANALPTLLSEGEFAA